MAEVILEYEPITGEDGGRWVTHAVGRRRRDKMWEGWIEFVPLSGGSPLRGRRETTQPSRDDLVYWATGITPIYLKGALIRALEPPLERPRPRRIKPHFAGPAPEVVPDPPSPLVPHPILDPFDVYAQGEDILIRQLDALDTSHLRDIALAYELMTPVEADKATRLVLATSIIDAARSGASRV